MPRRLAVLAGLVCVAALVAACGGSGRSGSGAGDPGSKTLSFFDHDAFTNPGGQAMIKAYEKSHPGTTIQIAKMPPGDPNPVIRAELAGGTAPDVVTLGTVQQTWPDLNKHWWMDLTKFAMAPNPYVKGNKHWIDELTPGAARDLKFSNGKIYSLSTTGFDVGFFYNKTIFAKLGITVPSTFAELLSDLQKAKSAGYIPLVWELGDTQYGDQDPQYLTILEGTVMHSAIAKMDTNHDGVVSVKELVQGIRDGVYSAQNPDYQASWKIMKLLAPYFQLGAASATSTTPGLETFKTGRAAMWFEGSFNAAALDQTNLHWGAFQTPRLTKQTTQYATNGPQPTGGFGACCGYPWSIPVTTEKDGKVKLAVNFLDWLSQPAITQRYAANSGVLSMLKSAKVAPQLKPFAEAASNVSPLADAELSLRPEFIETRSRLLEEYLQGSISLTSAMSQMETEIKASAAQAAQQYGIH